MFHLEGDTMDLTEVTVSFPGKMVHEHLLLVTSDDVSGLFLSSLLQMSGFWQFLPHDAMLAQYLLSFCVHLSVCHKLVLY